MMHSKLHKILPLCALLILAACTQEELTGISVSDKGKTPLTITALLDANSNTKQTRAENQTFDKGDVLIAYLRHVTWNGITDKDDANENMPKPLENKPIEKKIEMAKGDSTMRLYKGDDIKPIGTHELLGITAYDGQATGGNTQITSDFTIDHALYWDDFSESTTDRDLHEDGHYLESYYGYCYNGGTPTVELNETTGVLGWSVATDQSIVPTDPTETSNFQKSDLLWSAEQVPVKYEKGETQASDHNSIVIPYTHAMSKVTIIVKGGAGLENYDYANTSITLNNVRLKCTATAPTATLAYPGKDDTSAKGPVTMRPGDGTGTRKFEAIIVPSVLTVGNTFASISNLGGNNFTIPVTPEMVRAAQGDNGGWGTELTEDIEDVNHGTAQAKPTTITRADDATINRGKGYQMHSGVNYVLTVEMSKTEIKVSALLKDWDEVEAEGKGEIHFANDVKDNIYNGIDTELQAYGIDVYMTAKAAGTTAPTNADYGTRATRMQWNKPTSVWKYSPAIYWQGNEEYFRALSNVKQDIASTTENESLTMTNGQDALWGTTPEHNGTDADGYPYDYKEGNALKPRTADVPLTFYHAMSKITFNLVDDNAGGDDAARLPLAGATIQITGLATGGTLNLHDGSITIADQIPADQKTFSEDVAPVRKGYYAANDASITDPVQKEYILKDYIITPQPLTNAMVTITLTDGTVYKVKLSDCTIKDQSTKVDSWYGNKEYVYEITLGKEGIIFRAQIKEWDKKETSGNATLEWD